MGKRIVAEDTVDDAIHFLQRLQAEGWGVTKVEHEVSYFDLPSGKRRIPVEAVLTVRLIPSHR